MAILHTSMQTRHKNMKSHFSAPNNVSAMIAANPTIILVASKKLPIAPFSCSEYTYMVIEITE